MKPLFIKPFFYLLLCLLWPVAQAQAAEALTQEGLKALLQAHSSPLSSLQSNFVQTTSIPMLVEPITSKGRFLFAAPASLRWEYTDPVEDGFILTQNTFVRWENGKANVIRKKPAQDPLGVFLARQLLMWITMDAAAITKEYEASLIHTAPLVLSLIPKQAATREAVSSLTLTFTPQGVASNVLLKEPNGGETNITFTGVRLNEPIPALEFTE